VFDILTKEKSMPLDALKNQSGLSNKQWDNTIKNLRTHGLVNVVKTEDNMLVEVIE
jgi:lysyl-tRNA synthetase class 2